jgi:hypothetical protein
MDKPPPVVEKTPPANDRPQAAPPDVAAAPTETSTTTATSPARHEDNAAKGSGKQPKAKSAGKEAGLSPTLLADLEAAERALAANDLGEAIRRARHSLYERKTARASAILTRAFCMQHDLGAAKAELAHVAAADRARILRVCRAAGLDL